MLIPIPPLFECLRQPWMTWLESSTRNWPNMDYLTRQAIMFVDLWFDNSSRRCSSFSIHSWSQITIKSVWAKRNLIVFTMKNREIVSFAWPIFKALSQCLVTNKNQSFLLRAYLFQCIFLFFMCCPMQVFISSMWLEWDVIKIQISLWRSSYIRVTATAAATLLYGIEYPFSALLSCDQ